MNQIYLDEDNIKHSLCVVLKENLIRQFLLVCDKFFLTTKVFDLIQECAKELNIKFFVFSNFEPNPKYESVVLGTELFKTKKCEMIIAAGGGSALDVAKCIKLFSNMNSSQNYLEQPIIANNIKILAIPTTAGTGSEATRFSVIYYNGEKQSINHASCIPEYVCLMPSVLQSLPEYQRKSTMIDAMCHAIESYWSINSTEESKKYSRISLKLIHENKEAYLANMMDGNSNMLLAANYAGKAIDITQTTAAHAMCYKLTTQFGISHGHAAGLCLTKVWRFMCDHIDNCIDVRGKEYLLKTFNELSKMFGFMEPLQAIETLEGIMREMNLSAPAISGDSETVLSKLSKSVNPVRLKNNPIKMDENQLNQVYHMIFGMENECYGN